MMTRTQEVYLDEAKQFWRHGRPIPLDLAALMMDEGLDVETLERKYRAS